MSITHKLISSVVLGAALFAAALPVLADTPPGAGREVRISDAGKVTVAGARITAVTGTTLAAEVKWGQATSVWSVETTAETRLQRRYDGASSIAEFVVGDLISFSGDLVQTSSALVVRARQVKDWSVQVRNATFSGVVASVNTSAKTFTMPAESYGTITVSVATSTTFTASTSSTTPPSFAEILPGVQVRVEGLFNTDQKLLTARTIRITRVVPPRPSKTTFDGTLLVLAASSTPTSFTYRIGRSTVTVMVPAGISIVDRNYAIASLANVRNGDRVRVYGTLTGTTLEATIVRDTSLPRTGR